MGDTTVGTLIVPVSPIRSIGKGGVGGTWVRSPTTERCTRKNTITSQSFAPDRCPQPSLGSQCGIGANITLCLSIGFNPQRNMEGKLTNLVPWHIAVISPMWSSLIGVAIVAKYGIADECPSIARTIHGMTVNSSSLARDTLPITTYLAFRCGGWRGGHALTTPLTRGRRYR